MLFSLFKPRPCLSRVSHQKNLLHYQNISSFCVLFTDSVIIVFPSGSCLQLKALWPTASTLDWHPLSFSSTPWPVARVWWTRQWKLPRPAICRYRLYLNCLPPLCLSQPQITDFVFFPLPAEAPGKVLGGSLLAVRPDSAQRHRRHHPVHLRWRWPGSCRHGGEGWATGVQEGPGQHPGEFRLQLRCPHPDHPHSFLIPFYNLHRSEAQLCGSVMNLCQRLPLLSGFIAHRRGESKL